MSARTRNARTRAGLSSRETNATCADEGGEVTALRIGPSEEPVELLRFVVEGRPARWQRTGGKGKRYTETDMRHAKRKVAACARKAMLAAGLRAPLEGPLALTVDAYRKRKRDATPDWDNVGKLVSDAINKIVYRDDAQVVDGRVRKHDTQFVGGEERTVVVIARVEEVKARRARKVG